MVDRPAGGSQPKPSGQSRGRHRDTLETTSLSYSELTKFPPHFLNIYKKCSLLFELTSHPESYGLLLFMPLSQTAQTVNRRMKKYTRKVVVYFLRWPMLTMAVQIQMCSLLKAQNWTRTDGEIVALFNYPSMCLLFSPQFALPHLSHGMCEVTFTRRKASPGELHRQRQQAQSTVNTARSRPGKAPGDQILMQWGGRQAWERTYPWLRNSKELRTVQI